MFNKRTSQYEIYMYEAERFSFLPGGAYPRVPANPLKLL